MTSVGDGTRNQKSGGPWFAIGFFLAVGATFALVFTDDHRWLRLGILAALWAALAGSFVALKYRRQMVSDQSSLVRAQEIYELELEREIAARKEFELETETQARRRVAEDSREEIDALRAEIFTLRENLQALFGGEVLWERVALTAQSTRMRSLQEESPSLAPGVHNTGLPGSAVANAEHVVEYPTRVIDRVPEREVAASSVLEQNGDATAGAHDDPGGAPRSGTPVSHAVHGDAAQQRTTPPPRRVPPPQRTGLAMARASAGVDRARAETAENGAGHDRSVGEHHPGAQQAQPSRDRVARGRVAPERPAGERGHTSNRGQSSEASSATSRSRPPQAAPSPPSSARSRAHGQLPLEQTKPAMDQVPRSRPASAVTPSAHQFANSATADDGGPFMSDESPGDDRAFSRDSNADPVPGPQVSAPGSQRHEHGQPETNRSVRSMLNPQADEGHEGQGGRRRRAESDVDPVPTTPPAADSRDVASDGLTGQQDGHAQEAQESGVPSSSGDSRSSTEEDAESSGAHSTGRSVNELLAAHGVSTATPRRRRRRAED